MNTDITNERTIETIDTQNKSLQSLYKEARLIQDDTYDYMVTCVSHRNMRFYPESGNLRFTTADHMYNYKLTPFSMGQLCTKLEVPARYIDKCIKKGQLELAADNINTWLEDYNKDLFIRTYKDRVRGILSNRYMTLDAPDILSVLSDVVDPNQYAVKGHYLTPERFHARVVDRNQMTKKEDLFAGLQIDSSDVGRSTLTVTFFVYKLVCTNGLIAPVKGGVLYSQKHLGNSEREIAEFREGFKTAMQQIPEIAKTYTDMIEKAQNKDLKFYPEISKDLITSLMSETGLSEEAVNKVFEVREKYPSNTWGFINAMTEVAQDYTLERRIEIEKIAGQMLMRVA